MANVTRPRAFTLLYSDRRRSDTNSRRFHSVSAGGNSSSDKAGLARRPDNAPSVSGCRLRRRRSRVPTAGRPPRRRGPIGRTLFQFICRRRSLQWSRPGRRLASDGRHSPPDPTGRLPLRHTIRIMAEKNYRPACAGGGRVRGTRDGAAAPRRAGRQVG